MYNITRVVNRLVGSVPDSKLTALIIFAVEIPTISVRAFRVHRSVNEEASSTLYESTFRNHNEGWRPSNEPIQMRRPDCIKICSLVSLLATHLTLEAIQTY